MRAGCLLSGTCQQCGERLYDGQILTGHAIACRASAPVAQHTASADLRINAEVIDQVRHHCMEVREAESHATHAQNAGSCIGRTCGERTQHAHCCAGDATSCQARMQSHLAPQGAMPLHDDAAATAKVRVPRSPQLRQGMRPCHWQAI